MIRWFWTLPSQWPLAGRGIGMAAVSALLTQTSRIWSGICPIVGAILVAILIASWLFSASVWQASKNYFSPRRKVQDTKKYAGRIAGEKVEFLLSQIVNKNVTPTAFDLSNAAVRHYIHQTAGKTDPIILPGNFKVYAHCVQHIMECIREMTGNHEVTRATAYTYFRRSLFEWYNPFIKVVSINDETKAVPYTEGWWEEYKRYMAGFRNPEENKNILILRLVSHPRHFVTIEESSDIDFGGVTPEQFHERFFVLGDPHEPTADSLKDHCRHAGYRLVPPIKSEDSAYNNHFRTTRVNCLLERIEPSAATLPRPWRHMDDHFSDYHTNKYKNIDIGSTPSGAYFAYSNKGLWEAYIDVFAVELDTVKNGVATKTYFGIALHADGFTDAEGIVLWESKEVENYIVKFRAELERSKNNDFCVVAIGRRPATVPDKVV